MVISTLESPSIQRAAPTQAINTSPGSGRHKEEHSTLRDPVDKQPTRVSTAEVEKAIARLDKLVAPSARALEFSLDDSSGEIVVRVVDAETRKVVRQVPSEELLAISRGLDRLKGLLIQQKA